MKKGPNDTTMDKYLFPEKTKCYGWDCVCLSKGKLSLMIAPDIGGRIISLKYDGEEVLFVDEAKAGQRINLAGDVDLIKIKRSLGFPIWGGDKTWVSPQSNWLEGAPPLDLDSGQYELILKENYIEMISPVDRETGMQIIREVSLTESNQIVLNQTLLNKGEDDSYFGLWNVTQMLHPFDLYFPAKRSTVYGDQRFPASKKHLLTQEGEWVKIACDKMLEFKFGAKIEPGIAVALRHHEDSTLALVKRFDVDPQAKYPENHNIEIYNSGQWNYFELEVLGPLVELAPGEKTTHAQVWSVGKLVGRATPSEAVLKLSEVLF